MKQLLKLAACALLAVSTASYATVTKNHDEIGGMVISVTVSGYIDAFSEFGTLERVPVGALKAEVGTEDGNLKSGDMNVPYSVTLDYTSSIYDGVKSYSDPLEFAVMDSYGELHGCKFTFNDQGDIQAMSLNGADRCEVVGQMLRITAVSW